MRNLLIYVTIAPIVVAFLFVAVHLLAEFTLGFRAEFYRRRDNGATLIAATYFGIIIPINEFHRAGKERVRIAESRRNGALIETATVHHLGSLPVTADGTVAPQNHRNPGLTVVNGDKN